MTNWIAAIEKYRCLGIALGQFSEDAPTQCTKLTNYPMTAHTSQ